MTLKEMSCQYYEAADLQTELIKKNRQLLSEAVKNYDTDEEYRIGHLLQVLYEQRRDLLATAEKLEHYYISA